MRRLSLVLIAVTALAQQSRTIQIPADSTREIALRLATGPKPGDLLAFQATTSSLDVVLVTPDGKIVEEDHTNQTFELRTLTAQRGDPFTFAGTVGFKTAGPVGTYILRFTTWHGSGTAKVTATVTSELAEYVAGMRRIKGFKVTPRGHLSPNQGFLELNIEEDEVGGFIDIAPSEGSVELAITLPDGRIVRESDTAGEEFSWDRVDPDKPRNEVESVIAPFLLPEPGAHRLVFFEHMEKGRYRIQAIDKPSDAVAAIIPLERILSSGKR